MWFDAIGHNSKRRASTQLQKKIKTKQKNLRNKAWHNTHTNNILFFYQNESKKKQKIEDHGTLTRFGNEAKFKTARLINSLQLYNWIIITQIKNKHIKRINFVIHTRSVTIYIFIYILEKYINTKSFPSSSQVVVQDMIPQHRFRVAENYYRADYER